MAFSFKSIAVAAALIGAASFWCETSAAKEVGPFAQFSGNWRGAGHIKTRDGKAEPITCKAQYQISGEGSTLTQSLICAGDSYKFDIQSEIVADGHAVKGNWKETSRNIVGALSGQIENGNFDGTVDGGMFQASVSLRTNGHRQSVDISPNAGDIANVSVAMTHGG